MTDYERQKWAEGMAQATRELDDYRERIATLAAKCDLLSASLKKSDAEMDFLRAALTSAREEREKTRTEAASGRERIAALEARCDLLSAAWRKAEEEIDRLRDVIDAASEAHPDDEALRAVSEETP